MFKHILVPTDGSDLSLSAARNAVELARISGAHVTALHVAPAYRANITEDHVPPNFMFRADYVQHVEKEAKRHLDGVKKIADAAGVPCESRYELNDSPAEAIVDAAKQYACDASVMGSHGRKGLSRLLLGSETHKVLVSTDLPVMVTH